MNRQKLENLSGKIEPMHNWNNTEDFNAIPFVDVKEAVKELKKWIDEQHIHEFGNKGEDCDKDCWGKTFPKAIDKIFGKELAGAEGR